MFFKDRIRRGWQDACKLLFAALLLADLSSVLLNPYTALLAAAQTSAPGKGTPPSSTALQLITVDYPEAGSIFPPDMAAPTFLWRDAAEEATTWQIDIALADASPVHAHFLPRGALADRRNRSTLCCSHK